MMKDVETTLLDGLLDPVARCLTPEAAGQLAGLRADDKTQQRMDELAEKGGEGMLNEDEKAEYAAYISAANVLAIMQAKVRQRVAGGTAA